MRCPTCGLVLPDDAAACPACGRALRPRPISRPVTPPPNSRPIIPRVFFTAPDDETVAERPTNRLSPLRANARESRGVAIAVMAIIGVAAIVLVLFAVILQSALFGASGGTASAGRETSGGTTPPVVAPTATHLPATSTPIVLPTATPAAGTTPTTGTTGTFPANALTVDDSVSGTGLNQFHYLGGGWQHCTNCGQELYNQSNSWDNHQGDSVAIQFNGTQIRLHCVLDNHHGIVAVAIDGGPAVMIDLYSAQRHGDVPVWISPVLATGTHTLTLTVTGQKNPASSDTVVALDRVDIAP